MLRGHLGCPAGGQAWYGSAMERTRNCRGTLVRERARALRTLLGARFGRGAALFAVVGAFLLVALAPARAAAGNIQCHNPQPEEVDGRWKLKFTVNYGKKPHLAHVPMVFHFQHVTKYEWAYTEQSPEKPVFTRKPLHNQPEINVPVDVGFANASGEIFKITKMDVPIRRDPDMGFEAGEYQLTVREGGRVFGRPMRITFRGKNKPIDRRPITFQEKAVGPKKTKKGPPSSGGGDDPLKGQDMGDVMVDESGMEGVGDEEPDGPPAEKPKQGGCGCRLVDTRERPLGLAWLALLTLGATAAGRRRLRR